jgi:hypothetical protein
MATTPDLLRRGPVTADLRGIIPPRLTLMQRSSQKGPHDPWSWLSGKSRVSSVKSWSPDVAPGSQGRGRPTLLYGVEWATGQPAPSGRRRALPTPCDIINSDERTRAVSGWDGKPSIAIEDAAARRESHPPRCYSGHCVWTSGQDIPTTQVKIIEQDPP